MVTQSILNERLIQSTEKDFFKVARGCLNENIIQPTEKALLKVTECFERKIIHPADSCPV